MHFIRLWMQFFYSKMIQCSLGSAWRHWKCFNFKGDQVCLKAMRRRKIVNVGVLSLLWAALWTSTWAPTCTVFLTYVVTLFFGIKFLLKITTGIWHQSTSARSWFYSSTLDHRCAFACVLCMWSITVCLRMNTWNITYNNFFPARSWASGGQGVCSSAGQGVPLQERFTG